MQHKLQLMLALRSWATREFSAHRRTQPIAKIGDENTSGGEAKCFLRGEATARGWQLPRLRGALKVWMCRGLGAVAGISPFRRIGTTFQACQMFVRISHMARLNVIVNGEAVDVMSSTPVSDFAKVPWILAVPLQIQADLAL